MVNDACPRLPDSAPHSPSALLRACFGVMKALPNRIQEKIPLEFLRSKVKVGGSTVRPL
jgi:hypothetical protein